MEVAPGLLAEPGNAARHLCLHLGGNDQRHPGHRGGGRRLRQRQPPARPRRQHRLRQPSAATRPPRRPPMRCATSSSMPSPHRRAAALRPAPRSPPGSRPWCRCRPLPASGRAPRRWRSITRARSSPPPSPSTCRTGVPMGQATGRDQPHHGRDQCADLRPWRVRRHRAAVPASRFANMPLLLLAAILTIYIMLGMLYESLIHPAHHPLHPAVGGRGRGAGAADLPDRVRPDRHDRRHPADRHREEERHHHDRFRHRRCSGARICSSREAIYRACLLRFRPIMMTTIGAILGALPLAIGLGEGSELRQPLGISIVGGLFLSQILTLYTTPVVYPLHGPLRRAGRRCLEPLVSRHDGRQAMAAIDRCRASRAAPAQQRSNRSGRRYAKRSARELKRRAIQHDR